MSFSALGAQPQVPNCAPDGIAVGGYDLVSYRSTEGPVSGQAEHVATIAGLRYLFSSAENLQAFLDKPQRYLPLYRGWCATTLAYGKLACPEYLNFKIENDRLLLFEHTGFTNGRNLWNSDPAQHRRRADAHFQQLTQ